MQGTLTHGDFVKLAYRLGREGATGELSIIELPQMARHRLFLRRGYVTSAQLAGDQAPLGQILRDAGVIDAGQLRRSLEEATTQGPALHGRVLRAQGAVSDAALEAALRRQAELRLERVAAMPTATYQFNPDALAPPVTRSGRPFALTTWARRHIEARVDAVRARQVHADLFGKRLALRKDLAPEPLDCDDTDRRILAALATPRRLDEVLRLAHAPQLRLLAFVIFLSQVGALEGVVPRAQAPRPLSAREVEARRTLGVAVDADDLAVKQAFRRLARRWHPDMHPGMGADERRALAARFADVTSAYRALR